MAHMIEKNQMAFVGETPWHGLGVEVPAGSTGAEMLKVAGLDWQVQRRQLAMRNGQGVDLLTNPLTGYRAIVRATDDKVFQIATDGYKVVQNAEVVDFFREYCEAGHATMETVGALRDGAVIWALARLNGGSTKVIQPGADASGLNQPDELRGYMLLATSHDASLKTIGQPTQVRVVCHNTLTAALGSKGQHTYSLRHSSKFDDVAKARAREVMGVAIEQIAELNDLSAQLAKVPIDEKGWMDFMTSILGPDGVLNPETAELSKMAEDIRVATMTSPGSNLATARGTLWGAVNGVTYFADHVKRSRSQQNRLFSAWFGDGDILKRRAMVQAVEMAGIAA
jgi:phage/plasmid-like protein (TIGR03299 family)